VPVWRHFHRKGIDDRIPEDWSISIARDAGGTGRRSRGPGSRLRARGL